MDSKRQLQVASLVKRHFSTVLQQEGTYVFGAQPLVTVTEVKVTPDLNDAKIYLSVYNVDDKQSVILLIEEQMERVQQLFAARMRKLVRRVPTVRVFMDDTLDEMYRIDELFKRLEADNQMGAKHTESGE